MITQDLHKVELDSTAWCLQHEAYCRAVELMVTFDQLSVGSLASAEFLCRQIQMQEERWRERANNAGDTAGSLQDAHVYAGLATRGNICICPLLQEYVSDELKKETAVAKERRKAREERALAKPGK